LAKPTDAEIDLTAHPVVSFVTLVPWSAGDMGVPDQSQRAGVVQARQRVVRGVGRSRDGAARRSCPVTSIMDGTVQ
jgi:hypothetical protein